MNKRILTSVMALALALSLTVSAFAATYSDLTDHWAKTYMEDLADKGYLNGYSDGTMKPDKDITYSETLALLSRLYSLSDIQKEAIEADYGTVVKKEVPSTLSWAYENIEICMAVGIISETDLKSLDLTDNIEKQTLAVYLVRALQLTDAAGALSGVDLNFDDAASVSSDCVGSVAELVTLGVVKGDEKNNFSPSSNVTRAVVATMFSRSLDYLDSNNITLEISQYKGLSNTKGILYSVSPDSFVLSEFNGMRVEYSISSSTKITVNGLDKTLNSEYAGCYSSVTTNSSGVTSLAITSDSSTEWIQGKLSSFSASSGTSGYGYLYLKDLDSSVNTYHQVPYGVAVTQDGTDSSLNALKTGNFVTLKCVSDKVTGIYSMSADLTISGTVSELKYGSTTTLKLVDDNGTKYCFMLSLSDLPKIVRGKTEVTIDRIKKGNKVSLDISDCVIETITVSVEESTLEGELTSSTTTSTGTVWTILGTNGTTYSYTLDDEASAYSSTTEVNISDINIGDTVSVVVYNNTITEVTVQYSINTSTKVSGSVLIVNTSDKLVTILTASSKLIYINVSSVMSIINSSTGSTTSYSSIPLDSNIVVYGVYTDSRHFNAKSIIIE